MIESNKYNWLQKYNFRIDKGKEWELELKENPRKCSHWEKRQSTFMGSTPTPESGLVDYQLVLDYRAVFNQKKHLY